MKPVDNVLKLKKKLEIILIDIPLEFKTLNILLNVPNSLSHVSKLLP